MMLRRDDVFTSANGGAVNCLSADGEILATLAIPAGVTKASAYLALIPEGTAELAFSKVERVRPAHRLRVQHYGQKAYETGANPDFKPTSATRLEREMRVTMARINKTEERLARRLRALDGVERIPQAPAPAPAPVEVVEPIQEAQSE